MQTTTQTIGPYLVTFTWDLEVSPIGPVRIEIESNPMSHVTTGISSTVLRHIQPVRPETPEDAPKDLKGLAKRVRSSTGDEYLAALAALYVAVAPETKSPSVDIAAMLDKGVSTVKAHLTQARKRGFLTVTPHRRGGLLTDSGLAALNRASKEA